MSGMRLSRILRRAARITTTLEAVESGDPARITRRAGNVAKGRLLARVGFWRRLWK
jgi:hypothetical protein